MNAFSTVNLQDALRRLHGARPAKDLLAVLQKHLLPTPSPPVPLWRGQVGRASVYLLVCWAGWRPRCDSREIVGGPLPKGAQGEPCAGSREATRSPPGRPCWHCCMHACGR